MGSDPNDSAIALMAWDQGGKRLVGLMIVRRSDGHACFVEIPHELEKRLATLDRLFVEQHARELLSIAYQQLQSCEFEADRVVSCDFLLQGDVPATAGTMRHIPADRVAANPGGVATWESAGFLVDVGEVSLAALAPPRTYH